MNRHTISGWVLEVRPTGAADVTLVRVATLDEGPAGAEVDQHEVAFYGAAARSARWLKLGEYLLVEGRAKYRRGRAQLQAYTFYRVENRDEAPPGAVAALLGQSQGAS